MKSKRQLSLILVFTVVLQILSAITNTIKVKAEGLPKVTVVKQQSVKDDTHNTVFLNLQLRNDGADRVDLSKLTLKYWYTSDGIDDEEAVVDYSTIDKTQIKFLFNDLPAIYQNADRQLTIGFSTVNKFIEPGKSEYINLRFYSKQWKVLKQSNDYSCINNVTTYYENTLIDGIEPAYVQARQYIIKFDVKMYNKALDSNPSIYPEIKVKNIGNVKLDISKIKFRYYYTKDGDDNLNEVYYCDWCNRGNDKVIGTLNKVLQPKENYDHYMEVSFKDTAGILNVNDELEVQSRFNKSNWKPYNQQNDYSFDSKDTQYANWDKVEVIYEGKSYSGGMMDTSDIDGDGLPNSYELINTNTDPGKADSDNSGINDGLKDIDHDGLTNIEEYKLGTNPLSADSDSDGLTDGDEVHKYSTNPALYDTDGDGMGDGAEVSNGLNPLNKDTDGDGVIDSQEVFDQKLLDSKYRKVDIEESLVAPSLVIKGSGDYNNKLDINDISKDKVFGAIHSVVGHPFEIAHNIDLKFENAELSFKISDEALKTHKIENLKIAYYDGGENVLKLLDTTVDSANKTISTTVTHFSEYCVIDSEDYFYDIDVLNYNSKIENGKADVVFAIDTTGSMSWSIYNVQANINAIVDDLRAKKVDVRLGLVGFKDITWDGLYSTKDYGWFTNADDFANEVNSMIASGGGDWEESDVDGLEVSRNKGFRSSVSKYIILITDAPYKIGTKDNADMTMEQEIDLLKKDNISTSVVTNHCESYYEPLYTGTNGIVANIDGDFSSVLQPLIEKMSVISSDGAWIRLSNGSIVKLDKDPALGDHSIDTDIDGLPDLDELGREIEVSEFDWSTHTPVTYKCWTFKSNPAVADTDGDGVRDYRDKHRNKYEETVKLVDNKIIFNDSRIVWNFVGEDTDEALKEISEYNDFIDYEAGTDITLPPEIQHRLDLMHNAVQNKELDLSLNQLRLLFREDPYGVIYYMRDKSLDFKNELYKLIYGELGYYRHVNGKWEKIPDGESTDYNFLKGDILSDAEVLFGQGNMKIDAEIVAQIATDATVTFFLAYGFEYFAVLYEGASIFGFDLAYTMLSTGELKTQLAFVRGLESITAAASVEIEEASYIEKSMAVMEDNSGYILKIINADGTVMTTEISGAIADLETGLESNSGRLFDYMRSVVKEGDTFKIITPDGIELKLPETELSAKIQSDLQGKGMPYDASNQMTQNIIHDIEGMAEAVNGIRDAINTSNDMLNNLVTKVYSRANGIIDLEFTDVGRIQLDESALIGDLNDVNKKVWDDFTEGQWSKTVGDSIDDTQEVTTDGQIYTKNGRIKVLKPNITYTSNGYTYKTDEFGNIKTASGKLVLQDAPRNDYAQRVVGRLDRLDTDDGGHLIATRFNGSGNIDNLVPMDSNLNRGAWKSMENTWADALSANKEVKVNIEAVYDGVSQRPTDFIVEYSIDGQYTKVTFENIAGEVYRMNEKIESLYSQIAQKAIELIPTQWSKLLLYAEILPGVVTEAHYFVEENTGKVIQFGNIPNIFVIERNEFNRRSLGLTKLIRQLNKEFDNSNPKMWTTMTFMLTSDGEFNIDFGYDNLEETDITYRRQQWEKKYLNR